jgi:hypothetical protein
VAAKVVEHPVQRLVEGREDLDGSLSGEIERRAELDADRVSAEPVSVNRPCLVGPDDHRRDDQHSGATDHDRHTAEKGTDLSVDGALALGE